MQSPESDTTPGTVPAEPMYRIAVCLDDSPFGERLIPHASALARATGGSLTLLHVLEAPPCGSTADPVEWEMRRSEAKRHLARLAEERAEAGPLLEAELVEGQPAEQLCHWASHHRLDVAVLSSHGAGGQTAWMLAGTARKLVEGMPCSFLLVPAALGHVPEVHYRRVLVPLDGSARAESVLPLAMRVAAAERAELLLVHVVPVPELTEIGPPTGEDEALRERLMDRNERVAAAYLDRLRTRLNADDTTVRTLLVRNGDARTRLLGVVADEEVDLVVMSAHGRGGRLEAPYGSVADYLVAHASRPLLIVREPAAHRARLAKARAAPSSASHPGP
jgi:nucleotide-binding universal stress UspA family protein